MAGEAIGADGPSAGLGVADGDEAVQAIVLAIRSDTTSVAFEMTWMGRAASRMVPSSELDSWAEHARSASGIRYGRGRAGRIHKAAADGRRDTIAVCSMSWVSVSRSTSSRSRAA